LGLVLGLALIVWLVLDGWHVTAGSLAFLLFCILGMVIAFGIFFQRLGMILAFCMNSWYERRAAAQKSKKLLNFESGKASRQAEDQGGKLQSETSMQVKENR
jgi:hypothetical protein